MGEHQGVRWACPFCGTGGAVPDESALEAARCDLCGRPVVAAEGAGTPRRTGRHARADDEGQDEPPPLTGAPGVPLDDLPRTRSGRIPQWMLDEAAGRRVEPAGWRSTPRPLDETVLSSAPARRRSRRSGRSIVSAIVLVALVAGSWGLRWWQSEGRVGASHPQVPAALGLPRAADPATASPNRPVNGPTAGFEEAKAPLGVPPELAWDAAPYAFISTQTKPGSEGAPVAWSPCRPIHVVVNTTGAPADLDRYVRVVMGELTRATGLQFVDDGPTDEPPTPDRQPYQPTRYGDRWAPVVVGFTDERVIPALAGRVVGVATPMPLTRSDLDYSVIASASLWLDDTLLAEPGTSDGPAWLPVLRHEFGHVIGLGHVDDPSQLMNPAMVAGVDDYRSGDLHGLARLGKGRCSPDL